MPRSLWRGAVSWGLVTIPVQVMSATEDRSVRFHQVHTKDGGRVRRRMVCELDDEVLGQEDIARGYEAGATMVAITDEDLDAMPLPTARAIEIHAFVPLESIDPVRIGPGYYLAADGAVAARPYVLLRRALERSGKVAVAKFAMRDRERLGLLRVRGEVLAMHSMRWPDEIRDPGALAPPETVQVEEAEVKRALSLVEEMTAEPEALAQYRDHYREALEELLAAKAAARELHLVEAEAPRAGKVVDLMAALEQSVQEARHARGEDTSDAVVHDLPQKRTAKKTAKKTSKTASAKKPAARKTTGKKASPRRPRSA
ncbi:Ku protein [Streptomyces sp. NPDC020719]|uniref:non-homologous end joining protein Ku n=1 Tax=Streptomyces sp. NPDC020719 TaxID=3154896 RepID=UPI0033DC2DAB